MAIKHGLVYSYKNYKQYIMLLLIAQFINFYMKLSLYLRFIEL